LRQSNYSHQRAFERNAHFQRISKAIMQAIGGANFHDALAIAARQIGIERYCVVLRGSSPETPCRVIAAGELGQSVPVGVDGMQIDGGAIPPPSVLNVSSPWSLLVVPVINNGLQGCIWMEATNSDPSAYSDFARVVAQGLSIVQILHQLRDQSQELQRNNRELTDEVHLRKQTEAQLAYLAMHDSLTGLPNRALLMDRLESAVRRSERLRDPGMAVLFLDLDGFKQVNDAYGHGVGDALLQVVAQKLRSCVRNSDTVARLGGDEFVIVLEELSEAERAEEVASRVLEAVGSISEVCGKSVTIGVSIGLAHFDRRVRTPIALLRSADSAMYVAKTNGKGQTVVYTT